MCRAPAEGPGARGEQAVTVLPRAGNEARSDRRGNEQHAHEQQSTTEENGCEESVLGFTYAVTQDAYEPEERDPRKRDKTESEQNRISPRTIREPPPSVGGVCRNGRPNQNESNGKED